MNKSLLRILIVVFVGFGGYFAHTQWQTQLGEAALKATSLEFLPLQAALVRAHAQGKPVLVDFSAIWCPTCRAMHEQVFTNALVKRSISQGYVLARVDYESAEAPEFMKRYAVQGFPSLLVISADGALLRRVPVNFDPAAFAASLRS